MIKSKIQLPRIYAVLFTVFVGYFALSLKLFSVTVLPSFFYNKSSITQSSSNLKRADIVDRNGELLAINLVTTSVYANPNFITDAADTARKLHKACGVKYQDILRKLKSKNSFVWIKRNVTPKEEQLIHDLGVPGLYFERSERRAYPHGPVFSHLLGYVGLDGNGLAGIERYFDNKLKRKEGDIELSPLQLSIDIKAQNIIRDELIRAVSEFNAKGAIGILQDVNNGEIFALVSLPDYDPHNPGKASDEELFNKATLGSYEIGSVFKAFTIAAALDSDIIKLNHVYDVDTPLSLSGFQIKDFQGKGGWLSVPQILMYSSNIGIGQIALEMGKKKQIECLKNLGLISPLEVELYEKSSPSYAPLSKWNNLSTVTVSYGNGITVSPLHAVNVMSTLVNGGKLYSPTLLKGKAQEPKEALKESTSETMRKLLRMVVRFGSGKKANVDGFFIAGKTSTSNKVVNGKYSDTLRISSFISTFPAYKPRYAMLVMLDEPKGNKDTFGFATGGWVATPVTARIVEKLALSLGILPEHNRKEEIENELFVDYNPKSEIL